MTCGRSTILVLTGVLMVAVPAFAGTKTKTKQGREEDPGRDGGEHTEPARARRHPEPAVGQPDAAGADESEPTGHAHIHAGAVSGPAPNVAYVWISASTQMAA